MKFQAEINVMPLKALLDPQGKAVTQSLHSIGINELTDIRLGKHITLNVEAKTEAEALTLIDTACHKLLHNPVMESFEISIHKTTVKNK